MTIVKTNLTFSKTNYSSLNPLIAVWSFINCILILSKRRQSIKCQTTMNPLTRTGWPAISAADAAAANKHVIDLDFPWLGSKESRRIDKVATGTPGGVFDKCFPRSFGILESSIETNPVPEADLKKSARSWHQYLSYLLT